MTPSVLVITCGALARELIDVAGQNDWPHMKIQCLPASLHNTPDEIPGAVAGAIEKYRGRYRHIFVAYGDCGTGGRLDAILEHYGVERLPGAHCYEFFTGAAAFAALCDDEPGTFYLTDFLVRHFDRLVKRGLGLEQHPELKPAYFGNYRRIVYLAQSTSRELAAEARAHADYLGLAFEQRNTGLAPLGEALREQAIQWRN
jgi:hypothetical protein